MVSTTRQARKIIVTTTINKPTEAIKRFIDIAKRDGWIIVVAGDKKTPHEEYQAIERENEPGFFTYLTPASQEEKYPVLSRLIGWNCIQRRNFGLVFARQIQADIVAVVDDDNIPDEYWGRGVKVGQEAEVDMWSTDQPVFDSMAPFHHKFWHRGFPIQLLKDRLKVSLKGKEQIKVLVQAELWNGDPDVDAIARIAYAPEVQFQHDNLYAGDKISPFNSQNTFLHGSILEDYFLFPHIGRMDDIWASYYVQAIHGLCVAFGRASVFQARNPHNLAKDLEAELIGYKHSLDFIDSLTNSDDIATWMPEETVDAFVEYQRIMGKYDPS